MSINRRFYEACANGDLEAVKILLDAGADANVNCGCLSSPAFSSVYNREIPLAAAIRSGNIEMIEYLISKGANLGYIGYPDLFCAEKPFSDAIIDAVMNSKDDPAVVDILVKKYSLDVNLELATKGATRYTAECFMNGYGVEKILN